jgi:hypothetical protein
MALNYSDEFDLDVRLMNAADTGGGGGQPGPDDQERFLTTPACTDGTCATDCATCFTDCNQHTCAGTCNQATCVNTQCGQNTCVNTQCNQNTCVNTQCNQHTCVNTQCNQQTCATCAQITCGGPNPLCH